MADELRGILESRTSDPAELARAVELIDRAGSIDYVRAYSIDLVSGAKEALAPVPLDAGAKELLFSMADFFIHRLV